MAWPDLFVPCSGGTAVESETHNFQIDTTQLEADTIYEIELILKIDDEEVEQSPTGMCYRFRTSDGDDSGEYLGCFAKE